MFVSIYTFRGACKLIYGNTTNSKNLLWTKDGNGDDDGVEEEE